MEEEKTTKAEEKLCQACEDEGVEVSSWQDFEGWQDFVDGKIDEAQAAEQAKADMESHARSFGKYLVIDKEEPVSDEEITRKARAKLANRIYRKVCDETGMTVCFFNGFAVWSDYVDGRIDDRELYEKARVEVSELVKGAPEEN